MDAALSSATIPSGSLAQYIMNLLIDILNIIGGIGLLIFGLKAMSEALQRWLGHRLRLAASRHPASAGSLFRSWVYIGAVVQSPGAAASTVTDFLNVGLATLRQSAPMMAGISLGSLSLLWIIAIFGFELGTPFIAIPLVGAGALLLLSGKYAWHNTGEIVVGFALLMLGLNMMMLSLSSIAFTTDAWYYVRDYASLGIFSLILSALLGILLAAALRPVAVFALAALLCFADWIPCAAGAAMLMGAGLGATVAANFRASDMCIASRRAAVYNSAIYLLGLLWGLPLLAFLPRFYGAVGGGVATYEPLWLAGFLTIFFLVNAWLSLLLSDGIMGLVCRLVKGTARRNSNKLKARERAFLASTPELSLLAAEAEIANSAKRAVQMFGLVCQMPWMTEPEFREAVARVEKYERIADRVERETVAYLTGLSASEHSPRMSAALQTMYLTASHIEQMADTSFDMARLFHAHRSGFTQQQLGNLRDFFVIVEQALYRMVDNLEHPTSEGVDEARGIERAVNERYAAFYARPGEQGHDVPGYRELMAEGERLAGAAMRVSAAQTALL